MNCHRSSKPSCRGKLSDLLGCLCKSVLSFVCITLKIKPQIGKDNTGLTPFFFLFGPKVCRVQNWMRAVVILQLLRGQNKLWEVYQNQIPSLQYCTDIKSHDTAELVTSFPVALLAVALTCSGKFLSLSSSLQRKVPSYLPSNTGVLTLRWDTNHNIQDRFLCPLPSCKTNLAFYDWQTTIHIRTANLTSHRKGTLDFFQCIVQSCPLSTDCQRHVLVSTMLASAISITFNS